MAERNRKDELDFSEDTKQFLRELFGESIGSPSADKKLDAIIEMLHPVTDVPFIKQELSIVHGLQADVLTAINNLTKLVEEKFMGLKEDNEALNDRLDRVNTATDIIAADVTALKDELKTLNENTNVNLGSAIAKAEAIEARLTGIAGPNAGSDPDAPPVEPPPEG